MCVCLRSPIDCWLMCLVGLCVYLCFVSLHLAICLYATTCECVCVCVSYLISLRLDTLYHTGAILASTLLAGSLFAHVVVQSTRSF